MKRRTMLMLMLLGLGIASFPQVASAQSVEKSKSEHAKSTSARHPFGPLSPRVRAIVKRNTEADRTHPSWIPHCQGGGRGIGLPPCGGNHET
jgi:hypothetical protein